MARPKLTLAELVYRGTFRAERHADLLLTEELPEEAPGRRPREVLEDPAAIRTAAAELVEVLRNHVADLAEIELEELDGFRLPEPPSAYRRRFETWLRNGATIDELRLTVDRFAEELEELKARRRRGPAPSFPALVAQAAADLA